MHTEHTQRATRLGTIIAITSVASPRWTSARRARRGSGAGSMRAKGQASRTRSGRAGCARSEGRRAD